MVRKMSIHDISIDTWLVICNIVWALVVWAMKREVIIIKSDLITKDEFESYTSFEAAERESLRKDMHVIEIEAARTKAILEQLPTKDDIIDIQTRLQTLSEHLTVVAASRPSELRCSARDHQRS